MSKHEYYEDALFNLLMEEVSNEMGEEFLAEADELNELEEFDDEDRLRSLGTDTINRELNKEKRRERKVVALRTFRIASVAALLFLVIGIASYISIPQFRDYVREVLIGSPLPTETVSDYTGQIVAGNDPSKNFENYVEVSRSYDYTDTGIVETITYENPDTGDSFTVKSFTKYPEHSTDYSSTSGDGRILITPPPTPTPYSSGSYNYGGYNYGSYSNGGYSNGGYTYNGGMGYGRYSGYDPTTGAISIYPNIGPSMPNPLGINTSPGPQKIGLYP